MALRTVHVPDDFAGMFEVAERSDTIEVGEESPANTDELVGPGVCVRLAVKQGVEILHEPFRPRDLAEVVRRVLDR